MDKFSSACDEFSLVISVKKTVVLYQQGSLANPITVKDETRSPPSRSSPTWDRRSATTCQ